MELRKTVRSPGPVVREAALAAAGSLALAIAVNWEIVRHPASRITSDTADPLLQAWQLAWDGHALAHQPTNVFHANTFYPATDALAFSDSLLGYAPLGLIGSGPTAALVRYNLLFVLVAALAVWGPYLLARQLGSRWPGALVAGLICGYAPWRLSQLGHLNILSTGGIALALALLARGHGYPGARPIRPGLVVAGWAVAAWQVSLGFGLGLGFAMLLAAICLGAGFSWWHRGRPTIDRGLGIADLIGVGLLILTVTVLAQPYLSAVHAHPESRRTVADVALYSPPFKGLFLAPETSWMWGSLHSGARQGLGWAPEMCLLPGFVALFLAGVGLVVGRLSTVIKGVLVASVVVFSILALGTHGPFGGHLGFLLLHDYVPGWQGVRTPSRLVVFALLALGLLAAAGTDRLVGRVRTGGPAVALAVAALVLAEGIGPVDHPPVPARPGGFDAVAAGPTLVLPSDEIGDTAVMWWTTKGFPTVVNGGSGFVPRATTRIREQTANFPDPGAVDALRQIGVRTVVVVNDRLSAEQQQALVSAGLPAGVSLRRSSGVLVFSLGPDRP